VELDSCERMHTENFTASASAAADAPGLEHPDGEQPEIAGFDEPFGDPPPHAANPSPRARRAASIAAHRQPRHTLLSVWDGLCSAVGQRRPMPTTIRRLSTCCQTTYSGVIPQGDPAAVSEELAPSEVTFRSPWSSGPQQRRASGTFRLPLCLERAKRPGNRAEQHWSTRLGRGFHIRRIPEHAPGQCQQSQGACQQ
jgi:hypothetical protein